MPINNATQLSLSQIAGQLNAGAPAGHKEIRSTGSNLYVKDGPAFFTKVQSRINHRDNAVNLVQGGLAREFGVSQVVAGQIMTNVFGAMPTQVTVQQVGRLNTLGQSATNFQLGNTTAAQAFDIARRVEGLIAAGTPAPQAIAQGVSAAELIGPHANPQRAWALGAQVQALEAQGITHANALAQGQTAAQLVSANTDEATAFAIAGHVEQAKAGGMLGAQALQQGQTAAQLVSANTDEATAFAIAGHVEQAKAGGMLGAQALQQGQTAAQLVSANTDEATAFALAGHVEQAKAGGMLGAQALQQGQTAAQLVSANTDAATAFALAGHVEQAKAGGMLGAQALQQGQTAAQLVSANTDAATAFALAGHVEQAKAGGMLGAQALQQGQTAAQLVSANTDAATAFALAGHVEQAKAGGMLGAQALQQGLTAADIVAGGLQPSDAFAMAEVVDRRVGQGQDARPAAVGWAIGAFLLARDVASGAHPPAVPNQRPNGNGAYFMSAFRMQTGRLPTFEASSPAQQQTWLRLGQCCGASMPVRSAANIPLAQRNSMLLALAEHCAPLVNAGPGSYAAVRVPYEQMATLGRAIPIGDLIPASETAKQNQFYGAVKASPVLQNAHTNWAALTLIERRTAVVAMMDLHAAQFGYVRPQLSAQAMGPNDLGSYSAITDILTINIAHAQYGSFNDVFNSVVHESTHRYQAQLVQDFQAGAIVPPDDRYEQARTMVANQTAPVTEGLMTLFGSAPDVARQGYRWSPNETHAYHVGDTAQQEMAAWIH